MGLSSTVINTVFHSKTLIRGPVAQRVNSWPAKLAVRVRFLLKKKSFPINRIPLHSLS